MKEKVSKLIDVKSIVTILFTLAVLALAFIGEVSQELLSLYTMILGFYFGRQSDKPTK